MNNIEDLDFKESVEAVTELYPVSITYQYIDSYCFGIGRYELTQFTIPDGITEIGIDAFKDCRDLTTITIPDVITAIGKVAFKGCTSLQSVSIDV